MYGNLLEPGADNEPVYSSEQVAKIGDHINASLRKIDLRAQFLRNCHLDWYSRFKLSFDRINASLGIFPYSADLRAHLERHARRWLEPVRLMPTKTELIRRRRVVYVAYTNARNLLRELAWMDRTDVSKLADAVLKDLEQLSAFYTPLKIRENCSLRVFLAFYIGDLKEALKGLDERIPYTADREYRERRHNSALRTTRFRIWLAQLADVWEAHGLKVDMGADFHRFVNLSWPDPKRCAANGLNRPKPLHERSIVDWVAKVRHPTRTL